MYTNTKRVLLTTIVILGVAAICWIFILLMPEKPVNLPNMDANMYTMQSQEKYDVIVVGTDPEGIMAAVSAARNGMSVLLTDGRNRDKLGGLFTHGMLNTLDLNLAPGFPMLEKKLYFLNEGLFREWFDYVKTTSFDTTEAAAAFFKMVKDEENIELLLKATDIQPLVLHTDKGKAVSGLQITKQDGTISEVVANVIIDATQDADIAAAAGAPFYWGREQIGNKEALTAVTLVIKISGVTDRVWKQMGEHGNNGYFGQTMWGFDEAYQYVASDPERVRTRALNIGRQNDGTALINAMMIFGVDPRDKQARQEAIEEGRMEAERFINYLKTNVKALESISFAGVADELYVRESRHIKGEYQLTIRDLMENRDHWDAIAYGSYQVDLHSTGGQDRGSILMKPRQYGVPLRSLVPLEVDNLLVVGRSASFDTLAHGSARVVPLGMATGQAAGAAAAAATEAGITVRELSSSEQHVSKLQDTLRAQGVQLNMYDFPAPDYLKHKSYRGLATAMSLLLTSGKYENDNWNLDESSNILRLANFRYQLMKIYPENFSGNYEAATKDLSGKKLQEENVTLERALMMFGAWMQLPQEQWNEDYFVEEGWLQVNTLKLLDNKEQLTNGEVFLLIDDLLRGLDILDR